MLTAIAELARRRPAERTAPAPTGEFPAQLSEFIGDEVAPALTLSGRMADVYLSEATRVLTDDQTQEIEALILPTAGLYM